MGESIFKHLGQRGKVFLLLALCTGQTYAGVRITEIMQSNFGGVIDYYNEFPDSWVEIHNSGSEGIDLKGYSISKKNNIDSAYTIPISLSVPADGYTLIYCDKENIKQHTDFRLNSDKPGTVYLWDSQGVLQDSMSYPEMISPEVSWGRLSDNPDSLSHFRIATPGEANNNTHTERILKKVDFSVDGGVKKEAFYLKLSMKGDYPGDAVIRYTTDGSEPNNTSNIFRDSIPIYKNTVIRAKPFSDSAISKISKTQTYIFDRDDKMPIISIACDESYLYSNQIGIMSSSEKYAQTHPDNLPWRSWMGLQNYFYDWRRPINIEYYSGGLGVDFNQLSETRVSGNISRHEAQVKSLVVYANKRFGDKHFKGAFWEHLKPDANKQKSMTIRSCNASDKSFALRDMLSQTAIGRFAKYYDVDFQAQRNVQLYINGEFQQIMHLQERDNDDYVWANHNVTDIEALETKDGIYNDLFSPEEFPNYIHFENTFKSPNSTYQEMADLLDINAFMNFVTSQAYFSNTDFPYNNVSLWYDKQGTKKWRWILKDLDATIHSFNFSYYNFLLRVEPFEDDEWANSEVACKVYQKMFSLEKFKQPYIDRACVLAGTAFSKENITYMLDSLVEDMSLALTMNELEDYIDKVEYIRTWNENKNSFYYYDLGHFFGLGDTTQLTIRSRQEDSLIFFNNNPLIENKFDGFFFEGRDLYLTHNNTLDLYGLEAPNTNDINYLYLGEMIETSDSAATRWTVIYDMEGQHISEHYANENLHYKIPSGAKNVYITDGYVGNGTTMVEPVLASRAPEDLIYMVYSVEGVFIGKYNHSELRDFRQNEEICIVVVLDSMGHKLYSLKLLKGVE